MRTLFHQKMKHYIRCRILTARQTMDISQDNMSSILGMSTRAYTKLESGKNCCSLVTFILFLRFCCPDRNAFMAELFDLIDELTNSAT